MNLSGMVATMTIEEPTDADIFLAYVEHLLYPVLNYSPDLNPIEKAWAKLKQLLRR
jgi:hypothetical protein